MRSSSSAWDLVRSIDSLPTLPDTALRFMELALDETSGRGDLVELIELDPALLLRAVSAAQGRAEVRDRLAGLLHQAPHRLRERDLLRLALAGHALDPQAPSGREAIEVFTAFHRHAVAVAAGARALALAMGHPQPDEAWAAGLLHGASTLALHALNADRSAPTWAGLAGRDPEQRSRQERETLGTDAVAVSRALVRDWSLSEEACEVLAPPADVDPSLEQQGEPDPDRPPELAQIVDAAARLALGAGHGSDLCPHAQRACPRVEALLEAAREFDVGAEIEAALARAGRAARPRSAAGPEAARTIARANGRLGILLAGLEGRVQDADAVIELLQYGLQRLGDGDPLPGIMYRALDVLGYQRMCLLAPDPLAGLLTVQRSMAFRGVKRVPEGDSMAFEPDSPAFDVPSVVYERDAVPENQRLLELLGASSCVIAPIETSASATPSFLCADYGPDGPAVPTGAEQYFSVVTDQVRVLLDYERLVLEKERLATVDPLTGAATRRRLMDRMEFLIAQTERTRWPLSILMLDLDHFKQFNDTLGHQKGDRLLQDLVSVLMANVRKGDIVARYGGEEFVVVLPGASLEAATDAGEELRQAVCGLGREQGDLYGGRSVSVSIGAATLQRDEDAESLIGRADVALYQAKEQGRNRVVPAA